MVADLEARTSRTVSFDRGDVTAVLNMIRNGLDFGQVHQHARGLVPSRLLAAYRYVERRRAESVESVEALLAHPNVDTLTAHGANARRLVPIPAFWIQRAITEQSPDVIAFVARYIRDEIDALETSVAVIEDQLAVPPSDDGEGHIALGRALYNPYDECLWDRPFYLPTRVGSLMPPRLADLLGEPT